MKSLIIAIALTVFSSAHATVAQPFIGTWQGKGTYILDGTLTQCSFVEMTFDGDKSTFSFVSGERKCDQHQETFTKVTMSLRNGGLYVGSQKVGEIKGTVLSAAYSMPDGPGRVRHWRMSMRASGSHLMYEESRTMDRDTTPLISFSGLLVNPSKPVTQVAIAPQQPTDPMHPGSSVYDFDFEKISMKVTGRNIDLFLPKEKPGQPTTPAPVIVFGHGQAIPVSGYEATFQHLAKRGIAVVFPAYSNGFFDQDWPRMAADFNRLADAAMKAHALRIDRTKVVYVGHSKGGYVSMMAAAASNGASTVRPRALLAFAPAGYDSGYLSALDPKIPVTLLWSDRDTVIKRSLVREIYDRLPSHSKQFVNVVSYDHTSPKIVADHFFSLTKATTVGGKTGVGPLHYFGTWKWMSGAVRDLLSGGAVQDEYLYGALASSTGSQQLDHVITRNF